MCSYSRVNSFCNWCRNYHYRISTRIVSTLIHTIQTSYLTVCINTLIFFTIILGKIFRCIITILNIIVQIKLISNIFAVSQIIHLSNRMNNLIIIYSTCDCQRSIVICCSIIYKTYLQILSICSPTHQCKLNY